MFKNESNHSSCSNNDKGEYTHILILSSLIVLLYYKRGPYQAKSLAWPSACRRQTTYGHFFLFLIFFYLTSPSLDVDIQVQPKLLPTVLQTYSVLSRILEKISLISPFLHCKYDMLRSCLQTHIKAKSNHFHG